ncbi:N-acetylglucosamine kinase [Calothrix sp. PCC 7507]|uniref:N-acetylglucosamine kinase n=1 Tax=Calothrix sp. PCC 7507 TaxID=99598 RepID=UPI00029ED105|nr:BadF/BadG/BcrA/BcrD ATPase family protein [Calothrix sp. PCC 7507]AFY31898.1 ATPase BadF/BadG/BcrA/BcrD type [Calothrix sp. PCC 7507]
MSYVLGIDGGGSKTVCVLMDRTRQVLGRGEAGASNYQSIGIPATSQSIQSAIQSAINNALNITKPIKISAICLGLAGVGRTADIEVIKGIVQDLQHNQLLSITWELPAANILICNDALIALVGGIGHSVCIVVAVGTGSIVFGRNHRGITKRVGGWGYILGDEGSAYKIAVAGMQAALKAYDGREKKTSLVECFQKYLDLDSIEDLIEVIYRRDWGVNKIANLAQIVDLVAALGDQVANQIIDDAVQELVKATSTVIEAIFNPDSILEVVTTGSVWKSRCKMHERFSASLVEKFPRVKVIFPRYEPTYGAGLLALKKLTDNC